MLNEEKYARELRWRKTLQDENAKLAIKLKDIQRAALMVGHDGEPSCDLCNLVKDIR